MKNVLLVGSSFSAVPIFSALKAHGLRVGVVGGLKDDPCHAFADASCFVDYSDRNLLLEVVKKQQPDYLCPTCNDYSYLSAAYVAEQMGFPGYDTYETTLILHEKSLFRAFCEKSGFPIPRAVPAGTVMDASALPLDFPVLVKPVDSFSGRGMTKVYGPEELQPAVDAARSSSRKDSVLVEEFFEGSLHSHSMFIQNGECMFDVIVDEFCSVYPYQVDCSNFPTQLSDAVQQSVRECIRELVHALKMCDGLLHTQFMANGEDIRLIECMRRAPGDLYYRMIERSTGVNGMDFYARPFIGLPIPKVNPIESPTLIARHTISVEEPVMVHSFSVDIPGGEDIQIVPLNESGHLLKEAPYDKLAIIFARFSDRESLFKQTPLMKESTSIQTMGV